MNTRTFAFAADMEAKKVSFDKLSDHAYAYTAEGDSNTGIIVGDDAVMVIDTQATPVMAQDVIRRIREITDKPIKYVLLSHYHAVRVLGASAYAPEQIIASQDTYDLLVERGEFDKASKKSCSPATWLSLMQRPMPVMPTSRIGRKRWTPFPRSNPKNGCPAAVLRSKPQHKYRRAWLAREPLSAICTPALKTVQPWGRPAQGLRSYPIPRPAHLDCRADVQMWKALEG